MVWTYQKQKILRRGGKKTQKNYTKKSFNNLDNHDGVISLQSQTSQNAKSGGPQEASLQKKLVEVMEFQLSYFKSLKMMLLKCCTQYARKFGKFSSGHRTGKGPFSFQSQRKQSQRMCKLTHSFTHLTRQQVMLKILLARLQEYVNHELPDVQDRFRKGRGARDQIANIHWTIEKSRDFQKNISFCFIDYAKAFEYVEYSKLWKSLQQMGLPDHLTCLL